MTKQIFENPYTPIAGYQANHDIPIDGYGITIETINYWLVEHQLSLFPHNQLAQTVIKDEQLDPTIDYENQADDLFDILSVFETDGPIDPNHPNIAFYNGCNIPLHCYLIWHGNNNDRTNLKAALTDIYQIPQSLRASFHQFIDEYAGDIIACDYC